jgi:hypothetical protein
MKVKNVRVDTHGRKLVGIYVCLAWIVTGG